MSDKPLIPHFDLPFRLISSSGVTLPAVVEQGTLNDVDNCVEVALRTERGLRPELPTFGVTDPTFQEMPLDINQIIDQVTSHEDRALLLLSEHPDRLDALVDSITVEAGLREDHRVKP